MRKRHMAAKLRLSSCLAYLNLPTPHGDFKSIFTDKVENLPYCALARKSRTECI